MPVNTAVGVSEVLRNILKNNETLNKFLKNNRRIQIARNLLANDNLMTRKSYKLYEKNNRGMLTKFKNFVTRKPKPVIVKNNKKFKNKTPQEIRNLILKLVNKYRYV